ncbi:hypothetical protein B0H17DRAFT_1206849 [Mycena rosella]|uniref:Uncharacterized protein n=1 Tax=Mycena rosella TaxID=1033263 RepID=A0AAD7GD41_MYCRO|nr:hypothetical protein B0H17DRAFT_1206849 [Mycena rosella]
MPPFQGALWQFFYKGTKPNTVHYHAYCRGCISLHRPASVPIPIDIDDDDGDTPALPPLTEEWFKKACEKVPSAAKKMARKLKGKQAHTAVEDSDSDSASSARPSKKRKQIVAVKKFMIQTPLKVFKGITILFSESQMERIQTQFLHATISANIPFQWVANPEVIALFMMFRSAAGKVIPSRKVLSGRLLKQETS